MGPLTSARMTSGRPAPNSEWARDGAANGARTRPAMATTPANRPAAVARRRKSASSGVPSVSTVRYVAARYAHITTPNRPISRPYGVAQPAANPDVSCPPATRMEPDAAAAAAVAWKKGARTLAAPDVTA